MKPLRLEMKGFASYRTHQCLDFRELENLFVITGPTGAGKSALLDGLTLALYGEIPRASLHERKEFISIGKSRAQVQLDFRAGRQDYRVARSFPREGAQQASLERIDAWDPVSTTPMCPEGGIREVDEKIVDILGLDYNAATKAIILPQNDFADFMKGKASQRRDILKRLLGLSKYDRVKSMANSKASKLETQAEGKQGILDSEEYAQATEKKRDDLQERLQEATRRFEQLQGLKEELGQQLEELQETAEKLDQLQRVEDELEQVQQQEAQLHRQAEKLSPELTEIQSRVEDTEQALKAARKRHQKTKEKLQKLQEETGGAAAISQLQEALRQKREAHREQEKHGQRIQKTEKQHQNTRDQKNQLQEELREAQDLLDQLEEKCQQLTQTLGEMDQRISDLEARGELEQQYTTTSDQHDQGTDQLAQARSRVQGLTGRLERVRRLRDQALQDQQVGHLRHNLEDGQDCPVCLQTVSEVPPAVEGHSTDEVDQVITQIQEKLEAKQDQVQKLQKEVGRLDSKKTSLQKQLNDLPEGDLQETQKKHKKLEAQKDEAEKEKIQTQRRVQKLEEKLQKLEARQESLKTRLEGLQEQKQAAGKREAQATERLQEGLGEIPENPEDRLEQSARKLRDAQDELEKREQKLDQARQDHQTAQEKLSNKQQARQGLQQKITQLATRLESQANALSRYAPQEPDRQPPSPNQEENLLASLQNIRNIREKIAEQAQKGQGKLLDRREQLRDQIIQKAQDEGLEVQQKQDTQIAEVVEEHIGEVRDQKVRLTQELESVKNRLEQKETFQEEIQELRQQAQKFKKLGTELQNNRFIKFLLEESFQELAAQASEELHYISGGKYSLQAEGYDFSVIDHHNADQKRSVVTLSGGETFLASLALALALSGSIRDLAGHSGGTRLDAIFIDEGFGALDPETLDMVIDALERLQAGDRMVGVITHVEKLGERIPNEVQVVPTGQGTEIRQ